MIIVTHKLSIATHCILLYIYFFKDFLRTLILVQYANDPTLVKTNPPMHKYVAASLSRNEEMMTNDYVCSLVF